MKILSKLSIILVLIGASFLPILQVHAQVNVILNGGFELWPSQPGPAPPPPWIPTNWELKSGTTWRDDVNVYAGLYSVRLQAPGTELTQRVNARSGCFYRVRLWYQTTGSVVVKVVVSWRDAADVQISWPVDCYLTPSAYWQQWVSRLFGPPPPGAVYVRVTLYETPASGSYPPNYVNFDDVELLEYAGLELSYDDGVVDFYNSASVGDQNAVRFSLPVGWASARLLTARYYIAQDPGYQFTVHVYASDRSTDLTTPFTVTPTSIGWFDVDLSTRNIVVTADFYLSIEFMTHLKPDIGADTTPPFDGRSWCYYTSTGSWVTASADYMIRAVVSDGVFHDLYLAVRGTNDRIYWRCKGPADPWTAWSVIPTGSTDDAPAIAIFDNRLWVAVKGRGTNAIYVNTMDLTSGSWSGWVRQPGAMRYAASLVASPSYLYMAVTGMDDRIYWRRTGPGWPPTWSAWLPVPGGFTGSAPAITYERLTNYWFYLAVRGVGTMDIWINRMSSATLLWSGWVKVSGATWYSPSLTVDGTKLYLSVCGGNNRIYWRSANLGWPPIWTGWSTTPTGSTDAAPSIAIYGNLLWFAVKGRSPSTSVWVNSMSTDTGQWSGWTRLDGATPSPLSLAG